MSIDDGVENLVFIGLVIVQCNCEQLHCTMTRLINGKSSIYDYSRLVRLNIVIFLPARE